MVRLRSSRTRWTAPRPGWAMQRHIADICGCLEGDVDLASRDDWETNHEFPVPSIAVIFRAETVQHANNTNHTQHNAHNNNKPKANTAASIARYDAIQRQILDKLVALRFLSFVARCREYSWRGNPRFWWHVLHNVCDSSHCDEFFSKELRSSFRHREDVPSCAPATDAEEALAMPNFELIFPDVKIKNELLQLCAQAFSSTPNEIFQRVEQRAQDMLTRLGVRIPQQPRTVKIDLNFSRSQIRMIHCVDGMQKLLGIAPETCETTHIPPMLFSVRCLNLSDTAIFERDLTPLAQIIMTQPAGGVAELKLNWVFTAKMPQRYMRSFCELMAACFAISLSESPVKTSLTKLCLNASTLSAFQLASLFSAVHESSSRHGVRELSLRGLEGRNSWLWLAFGILHPTSMSPIVHLDLSHCVLHLEDVELVRNLMPSADYSPYLMQRATAADSDRNSRNSKCLWALIAAGTRLEIPRDATKHAKSGRHAPALKLETELWCEALESGASWTCLLIPAYGKLYVKNARIIKTETRASNKHTCKLKRLVMNGAKTTSQNLRISEHGDLVRSLGAHPIHRVVPEWIKIVGYSLDTLHLRNNTLGTRALASVLESCPRLTELDVSGCELPDVGPITRAFRDENCILRILKVAQNHISTESQEDLFRLLRDVKCASIRNLQVLHLEDNPTSRENRSLQVLLRSLQRNKTLRQVVLSMDEKHFQNAQTLRYRFDRDHNDQWLGHEDLPIQHRLAVLSIPVFKALPTAVIEIIFDYAKRDVYRHVLWD